MRAEGDLVTKRENVLLLLTATCWLGIVLLLGGIAAKSEALEIIGGLLCIGTLLGVLALLIERTLVLAFLLPVAIKHRKMRTRLLEASAWFTDFALMKANTETEQKAKEMFTFLARYLGISPNIPIFKVLPLDEAGWNSVYEKVISPSDSRNVTLTLDDGTVIPANHTSWNGILGMCIHTAGLPQYRFPFEFLILLNRPSMEKTARSKTHGQEIELKIIHANLFENTLMHEIVHMLELVSAKKLMLRYIPGGLQDPFVVEAYNAFKEKTAAD